jgi:hypothetical protein
MAEELSLDGIKDMKKAEYIKAFKNKAAWKKAKAVILLVDYSNDLEDLSKITINVSPSTDHKIFDELSYKKVERIGTNVTFEGDLEKANIKFISDAMKKLVN